MKSPAKEKKLTAGEIAEKAMRGEDISQHFTKKGEMKPAIQRVNVDFSVDMLNELDDLAKELNISRQKEPYLETLGCATVKTGKRPVKRPSALSSLTIW